MKSNYLLTLLLVAIIFISGCTQYGGKQTTQSTTPTQTGNVIEITSSDFSPKTLTITAGETVTWINKDTQSHWPASAVHPIHTAYPEAGGCIGSKFDACKALAQDETFSFTFNQKGTWTYHDHLNSNSIGTIIVQ